MLLKIWFLYIFILICSCINNQEWLSPCTVSVEYILYFLKSDIFGYVFICRCNEWMNDIGFIVFGFVVTVGPVIGNSFYLYMHSALFWLYM